MDGLSPTLDKLLGDDTRARIIGAASDLIATGGSEAATTRAVAIAASVQAPTIYRLFGDKGGLLDAVAEQALANYVAGKAQYDSAVDPIEDLRQAWDTHIAFGLAHPAIFARMNAPRIGAPSRASIAGLAVLRERVRRIARTGRLRVTEERAIDLIHAVGTGTVLALLQKAPHEREGFSHAAREAVFTAVIGEQAHPVDTGAAGAASALRTYLDNVAVLTPGETQLLIELLQRISGHSANPVAPGVTTERL